jgi:hypothetical protein
MASSDGSPAPNGSAFMVLVPMGICLAIIASLAAYFLWPRGERIGRLDLRAAAPQLDVDLAAGDTLSFRLDATVGTTSGYPNSSRSRTNAVHDELAASKITIDLTLNGAAVGSATCGAFDGKATTSSSGSDDVATSGLPLRCTLRARNAGKHQLRARVAWVPRDVRAAMLEVRRQRTEK